MLITPPTIEPLTVAQGKLLAGLDWPEGDARDALMLGYIRAARSQVELDTGVALLAQTHAIPLRGSCASCLTLPWRPVASVTIADATATPWDPLFYTLDAGAVAGRAARLVGSLTGGAYFPTAGAWTVTIVAGFADVATLEAQAPGLVYAVGLLTAHFATYGRDLVQVGHIVARTPQGYDEAIAPYQLVSLA